MNVENLTNVRQTRWNPLLRPDRGVDGRWTVDAGVLTVPVSSTEAFGLKFWTVPSVARCHTERVSGAADSYFSIPHPCFNTNGSTLLAERDDYAGTGPITFGVRGVNRYSQLGAKQRAGLAATPAESESDLYAAPLSSACRDPVVIFNHRLFE